MAESVQRLRGTCFEVRSVKFVRNDEVLEKMKNEVIKFKKKIN